MNQPALAEVAVIRARLDALEKLLRAETPEEPKPAVDPLKTPATGLTEPGAFFAHVRAAKLLGENLSASEVDGCNAILAACAGVYPASWTAYALATAWLETAGTMQPIKEYGGTAYFRRMYDIEGERPAKARELGNIIPGDGIKYAGRGYVQLTGKANYVRAELELGEPLAANPDLALQPDIAARIMVRGMKEGWFTGKGLNAFIPAEPSRQNYVNARRIINGQDRAGEIADAALAFLKALKAGGWR